jgi:hypothetical protein
VNVYVLVRVDGACDCATYEKTGDYRITSEKREKIINQIKEKLIANNANNAMISKADKGNSLMIVT